MESQLLPLCHQRMNHMPPQRRFFLPVVHVAFRPEFIFSFHFQDVKGEKEDESSSSNASKSRVSPSETMIISSTFPPTYKIISRGSL